MILQRIFVGDVQGCSHELGLLLERANFVPGRHRLIPVATPQINGKVERSHRIDEEEFYRVEQYKEANLLKDKFQAWIYKYNYQRSHGGIKMQTPAHKLFKKLAAKNLVLDVAA